MAIHRGGDGEFYRLPWKLRIVIYVNGILHDCYSNCGQSASTCPDALSMIGPLSRVTLPVSAGAASVRCALAHGAGLRACNHRVQSIVTPRVMYNRMMGGAVAPEATQGSDFKRKLGVALFTVMVSRGFDFVVRAK
jgi:hypothetical protein